MGHGGGVVRLDPLPHQPPDDGGPGHRIEGDLDAPAHDGGQGRGEVVGHQHEHRAGGRLLHRLEEDRSGLGGQVEIGEDQHLAGGLHREPLRPGHDGPGLLHIQGRSGALHHDQIRVGPGQSPPTGVAHPTPAPGAQQGRGQGPGRHPLPRPGRTVQEIGVDRPPPGRP